jgi:SOS-response transcriptional repressor LexA
MNPIQQKLLDIAKLQDIEAIRRVDLVQMVNCEYPSQITHHLRQLIKRGDLIRVNNHLMPASKTSAGLIRIPIMGEADCGEATKFADGRIVDTLAVSPSILKTKITDRLYALLARGNSMNHAKINGKEIQDGDYIVIERRDNYVPADNDIVVSIIGGLANIKRLRRDNANKRILLLSDSYRQNDYSPIIISHNDDFQVDGKVVDVIKGLDSNNR